MDRVRRFPFLETKEEVDAFVLFCETSDFKCLRGLLNIFSCTNVIFTFAFADWINDKKSSPWFIPSVNRFMSKIPEMDWFLTPGDTNLNERAHPFTNMHTGINLSLLEAINQAQILDQEVAENFRLAEVNCVLFNDRNTKPERDHANRKRLDARAHLVTA